MRIFAMFLVTFWLAVPLQAGEGEACLPCSPRLWSPEDPHLYEVHFICQEDTLTERIGLRHITTAGTQLLLNGRPLFLRGICVHEDDLLLVGLACQLQLVRQVDDVFTHDGTFFVIHV